MASNSTTLSTAGGYTNGFTLSISWSENSTSVSNNTSNITATATLAKNTAIFWVTNAGVLRCYWHDNHDNTDRLIAESVIEEIGYENNNRSVGGTFNATHNDDGTLKGYAWAQWEAWSSYGGYPPVSGSVATSQENLTTIARASAPTMSASSITIPASSGTITVNTNRASSSFTHTITLKVGSTTIATYTGVGASKAINIADIDDAILATIPSATSATVDVSCQTFNGSTSIGTKSTSFTANVGSGAKPTFSNFTFADTNSTTTGITGNNQVMISGKSAIRATISAANKATAKYSATMVKYTFAIAGLSAEQAYSTSQITKDLGSPTVANTELPSGTRDLVVTAIDSRGLSTSVTKTVTIVPYQAPIINASATRANGFENTTTVKIAGTFSRIEVGGTAKNTVNASTGVAYRYKPQSSTTWNPDWTNKTATVNVANGTVSVADFTHELDNQTAYDFQFRITDKFTSSPSTASLVVSIGQPAFYIGTDGRVGVGGMPTRAKLPGDAGLIDIKGRYYGQEGIYSENDSVETDTPSAWSSKYGDGRRLVFYSASGKFTNQPTQYGIMETIIDGVNVYQTWYRFGGQLYVRGGNQNGWSGSSSATGAFTEIVRGKVTKTYFDYASVLDARIETIAGKDFSYSTAWTVTQIWSKTISNLTAGATYLIIAGTGLLYNKGWLKGDVSAQMATSTSGATLNVSNDYTMDTTGSARQLIGTLALGSSTTSVTLKLNLNAAQTGTYNIAATNLILIRIK